MPRPFTGPKMFWAGPNFLCQTKNLFTHCGRHKHFVPDKKMICIHYNWFLCQHRSFWRGTKCSQIFGLAQKIWIVTKHFGTCKRTRQKCFLKRVWSINYLILQWCLNVRWDYAIWLLIANYTLLWFQDQLGSYQF